MSKKCPSCDGRGKGQWSLTETEDQMCWECRGSGILIEPVQVKQIDVYGIMKKLRRNGDKETIRYIKSLQEALEHQQKLTRQAISKLRKNPS